ncbi:MAG: hypothetical protein A3E79_11640 [Burkholderiales bacterium RIFCSPHIGHO2_12_FULL_61_11]|nr:MAG: hypothetical protein A3E79_11640 [Burkholderiales bacterium RIFCSPHIGHO2_12_FULL_61_11]
MMKKSLIALAVLAASGAAMAQSSVTLYGRVDAALAGTKTTLGGVGTRQTGIQDGAGAGLTGSRWGIRGSEDLGGGLKANFMLENRFNVDNGTSSVTPFFAGSSYVSLSSGFGEVKLGRTYTPLFYVRGIAQLNNLWDTAFTPTVGVNGVGGDYAIRGDNSVTYDSPKFGGFKGSAMYAFGENKTATTDASSIAGLNLMYANGPVAVAYAHQREETRVGLVNANNKFNTLAAAYDFGVAALSAGYNHRKGDAPLATAGKDREYSIGVNVPVKAFAFSAGYAHSKYENGPLTTKGKGFALGAKYSLSKRTTLYTGYKRVKVDTGVAAAEQKITLLSAGVRHDF